MECLRIALVVVVLLCRSDGSSLAQTVRDSKAIDDMPPSPSPAPPASLNFGNVENCDNVINTCDIDYGITACVRSAGDGSQAANLLVQNGGSTSHKLNITIHPANRTQNNITIPGQDVVKIKISLPSNMEGNYSVTVNIGNKSCIVPIEALVPPGFSRRYVTPTHGAYLLFAAAVCIGGTWACCKLVKRRRHLGGVPYQELEMGQQESDRDPSFVIESPEGWDDNWDDDWDEEKAVRSPGARKALQNGASLKYIDTSQWGNDWDDD